MKSILALGFLLLASTSSFATATLTFTLTGAGAANTTKTLIVSDADGVRIMNYAKNKFGPVVIPPVLDAAACAITPNDPGCLPTTRAMTNKEAVDALLQALLNEIREGVITVERAAARISSDSAIVPINP